MLVLVRDLLVYSDCLKVKNGDFQAGGAKIWPLSSGFVHSPLEVREKGTPYPTLALNLRTS